MVWQYKGEIFLMYSYVSDQSFVKISDVHEKQQQQAEYYVYFDVYLCFFRITVYNMKLLFSQETIILSNITVGFTIKLTLGLFS